MKKIKGEKDDSTDLKQIDEASSRLKLEGACLPEAVLKMTGL